MRSKGSMSLAAGDKILVKRGKHKDKTMYVYQVEGDIVLARSSKQGRYLVTLHVNQVEVVDGEA